MIGSSTAVYVHVCANFSNHKVHKQAHMLSLYNCTKYGSGMSYANFDNHSTQKPAHNILKT